AAALNGDEPRQDPRQRVTVKPAWEWSLEDRIAKRIDPAATAGPIQFIVEGRRNPELLMPFELFGSVLGGIDPRFSDEVRTQYREAVTSFGWKEETFWRVLESAASELLRTQTESLGLQSRLSTLSPPDRRAMEMKIEELDYKQCRLRAEALRKVRTLLGRETFDHFLYAAVAPQISISSQFPIGDEAGRLRFIEGGCR